MEPYKTENVLFSQSCYLGIEFGSTRIKAVLIDEHHNIVAQGDHVWENQLVDGVWTYAMDDVVKGLQDCYYKLKCEVKEKYQVVLSKVDGIGISAMMHGYLVFDKDTHLLTPFRTWRNTMTQKASEELTSLFQYHIPQRWSIAHLYQSILNEETHVKEIAHQTTLAGYVHYRLTNERILGVGEASGMFPIDTNTKDYDQNMMDRFDEILVKHNIQWKMRDVLPSVKCAGEYAGCLSKTGAILLDPQGDLQAGIPFCPPEGDAGTGMVATNSIRKKTGNVSAGTSVFAMVVLEKQLQKVYEEIDLVTTPCGDLVAMVHCNNGTSELHSWVRMFHELLTSLQVKISIEDLYDHVFNKALQADEDGGGIFACNYLSGEHITGFEAGVPMVLRTSQASFHLANFILTQMYAALSTLKIGMDILIQKEGVTLDHMFGHGGFFKTAEVGQKIMSAALHAPVNVMETAGEGGAWGCAVLAAYMVHKDRYTSLLDYLDTCVFAQTNIQRVQADTRLQTGFDTYIQGFKQCFAVERCAIDALYKKGE